VGAFRQRPGAVDLSEKSVFARGEAAMKVAFHTLGCKVNQNDTDSMAQLFLERGYEVVPFAPGADIYIVNTCTVTKLGTRKSRQTVNQAVNYRPRLVAVTGCYPQVAPEEVTELPGVNLVIGMAERPHIVDLVEDLLTLKSTADSKPYPQKIVRVGKITEVTDWVNLPTGLTGVRTRANLKIEEGCDQFCSYCVIPYARGKVRSMPLGQVVAEFKKIIAAGYHEVVLSGIHLGAYGQDLGSDLNAVLTEVVKADGKFRVRLGSLEPTDFTEKLIANIVNNPKICQYLHIPLQSGSDRILKMMNRHYNLEYYAHLVENLRNNNPQLAIGTDLIVGFPGETESDFNTSCDFLTRLALTRIHVFRYSPRPGTPAARLPDRVPKAIQEARSQRIRSITAKTRLDYIRGFCGKTVEVLFEERSGNRWSGLTSEYLRVEVESVRELRNVLARVTVCEIVGDNLVGKIID
jgi:threonylcarbamoyladenosine tRNA methylthiotransferase MtaB